MEQKTLHSIETLERFAEEFLAAISPRDDGRATLLALSGDLGSGKTAFVKALGKLLGVTEHITSPTFVIMKKYPIALSGFEQLVHIDAYRLKDWSELSVLGWNEILSDKKNLIALEWPELVADIVPTDAITFAFSHVDENTRGVSSKFQAPNHKQPSNSKFGN